MLKLFTTNRTLAADKRITFYIIGISKSTEWGQDVNTYWKTSRNVNYPKKLNIYRLSKMDKKL